MSGFLLDTNVSSELTRPQPEAKIEAWIAAQSIDRLFISVVSIGEFRKGIALRPPGKRRTELESWFRTEVVTRFSRRILPMTFSIAERWGIRR